MKRPSNAEETVKFWEAAVKRLEDGLEEYKLSSPDHIGFYESHLRWCKNHLAVALAKRAEEMIEKSKRIKK